MSADTSIWHNPLERFRTRECLGENWLPSTFRGSRVDFIPADDVLEKIFGDENFVEGMYNDEESDIDRQLEN